MTDIYICSPPTTTTTTTTTYATGMLALPMV